MATLSVNFGKLDGVIRDLDTIVNDYTDRIDLLSDIKSSIDGTENEFGYLNSASFQISQKISELSDYKNDVSTFRDRVENFRETAYDEESGLASRLTTDSEAFMDAMGITPEYEKSTLQKLWEGFCEGVESIFNAVAEFTIGVIEWVEENWDTIKQALVVVGEILIAAAAITTFILTLPASGVIGVLTAIGAGWAAFKATTDVVCDSAALGYYLSGDEEKGKEMADYDARDLFHDAGEFLNEKTGLEFFDEITDVTYFGLDAIETIFSVDKTGWGDAGRLIDNVSNAGTMIKDFGEKGLWALLDIKDFSGFNGKDYDGVAKQVPDKLSEFLFGDKGKMKSGKTNLNLGIKLSEFVDNRSPEYKDTKITKVLKDIKTLSGIDGKNDASDIMKGLTVFGNVVRGDSPSYGLTMNPMMPLSPIAIGPIGGFGGGIGGGGFGGFGGGGMPPINIGPIIPNININIQFGPKGPIL